MRTIGLLGGMTWHSTATYYRRINEGIAAQLGPFRSARLLIYSIDYGLIRDCRQHNDWGQLRDELITGGRGLKRAGAQGLFICSNTVHRFEPQLRGTVGLPIVHVCDALADEVKRRGLNTVGLLGTQFTVTQRFYIDRLERNGLTVHTSSPEQIEEMNRIILEELARGVVLDDARQTYRRAMADLADAGAQIMLLSCTEIGMVVRPDDAEVPVLDSTEVHADAAVAWALGGQE